MCKEQSMNISRLEGELLEAQARYNAMQHASLEQRREAEAALLRAERAFSMAKGEETALACEWKVRWEPNAPMPHVLASEVQTYPIRVLGHGQKCVSRQRHTLLLHCGQGVSMSRRRQEAD